MNRDEIIQGAAKVVFNGATFYSATDQVIKLPLNPETFEVGAEGMSLRSTRLKDLTPMISITPEGRWSAAMIAALWPYSNAAKNARIFTNTDVPLVLHTQESHLYTLGAAAVHKMPQIMFSPVKTLIGPVEFCCLRKNAIPWETASSLIAHLTTTGVFTDATFSATTMKTQTYTAIWTGKTGFSGTSIETYGDDGFTFTPIVEVSPIILSGARTYNYFITKIGAEVSFRPATPTQAQILTELALQGAGNVPGKEMGTGADLTITGADGINYCIIKNAAFRSGGYAFGGEPRNDVVSFVAQPSYTSGVQQPCFVLSAT